MAGGRPRQFDIDAALDAALLLFIEKGYEGAAFAELTKAMGISPPSFYAAFGSKEKLFGKVLERYAAEVSAIREEAVLKPTAREVVAHLLTVLSRKLTQHPSAKGCLLVQGALVCSDNAAQVRDDLRNEREAITAALETRFEEARCAGDRTLPGDPRAIARLTSMVLVGLAAQAASGVSIEKIDAAVKSYVALFDG